MEKGGRGEKGKRGKADEGKRGKRGKGERKIWDTEKEEWKIAEKCY
jgi:hypothetical protein